MSFYVVQEVVFGEAELWRSKTVGRTPSTHRLRFFHNQLDIPLGYT